MAYRTFIILIATLMTLSSLQTQGHSSDQPFDPVGHWRTFHKDGTSFDIYILPDGTASSTADNQKGRWEWDNNRLVIKFSDGWCDVIEKDASGSMLKKSWPPNTSPAEPSLNISRIERVSSAPSPNP